MRRQNISPMAWVGIIAFAFMFLAFGSSYLVTRQVNKAADEHASSAGRSTDPQPNALQTQRSTPTTGQNPDSAVPPAR